MVILKIYLFGVFVKLLLAYEKISLALKANKNLRNKNARQEAALQLSKNTLLRRVSSVFFWPIDIVWLTVGYIKHLRSL
jgi:hypothetical protein